MCDPKGRCRLAVRQNISARFEGKLVFGIVAASLCLMTVTSAADDTRHGTGPVFNSMMRAVDDGDFSKQSAKEQYEREYVWFDDWVGIHHDGTPFRYSRGPEITSKEKDLLLSLINRINPDIIGFSVTDPLLNRI